MLSKKQGTIEAVQNKNELTQRMMKMPAKVECPKGYGQVTFSDELVCPIVMKTVPGGCIKCNAPKKPNKKMPKPRRS